MAEARGRTMSGYAASIARYRRARQVLAGGVSSNFRYHDLPVPLTFERGEGPWLWDADGNRYLDFVIGNGAAFLGHSPAAAIAAVAASLARGQTFASLHDEEVALARRLVEIVPCARRVRFEVSGTQGIQAALRLARARTGRDLVVKCEGHYHGWADNVFVSVAPPPNEAGPLRRPEALPGSAGQPASVCQNLLAVPYNDLAAVEAAAARHDGRIAALLLEPVACNCGVIEPLPGFLEGLRRLCDRRGIVLVFDEVVTGFRLAPGGAQQRYGVTPDLAVFAKAMGAGFPLAAVAGRADIMDTVLAGAVHGGTFNGATAAIAAGLATVEALADGNACAKAGRDGRRLMAGLGEIASRRALPLHAQGPGAVFSTTFSEKPLVNYRDYRASDDALRARFVKALQDRGVRMTARGTWFVPAVLAEGDIAFALEAADAAAASL